MKGLVKFEVGPGNMEIREMPEPVIQKGFVKIEVKAAGICGSDLHILHSDIAIPIKPPVITGHEFSGVVTEIGEGVTSCKVGDRVTSETAMTYCGNCHNCKSGRYNLCDKRLTLGYWYNGAFAQYTMVPQDRIHILTDSISFEEAALIEPLACVTHAAMNLSSIEAEDIVLISGPGVVGLMAMQVAKAHGAITIVSGTDIDSTRLAQAKNLGADHTINVSKQDLLREIALITRGIGVDIVYECSGAGIATRLGIEAVKKQGQFVQIGLAGKPMELLFDRICYKEIRVTGSLGSIWSSWKKAIQLVESGKVDLKALISHEFTLEEWSKAFNAFEQKEGFKILFNS